MMNSLKKHLILDGLDNVLSFKLKSTLDLVNRCGLKDSVAANSSIFSRVGLRKMWTRLLHCYSGGC